MYRISVTTLEKFRRFRDKASIYDTEESLIETLSGVRRPSAYDRVRTDGMEAYNRQIVNDFCAFIEDRKLHHLLKTKEDLYNA